jgi:epoxide hydrolase
VTTGAVQPFSLAVPQHELDDLRERLARTRWPERETVGDWSQGIPLAYVQDLCRYWAESYDWRRAEAALNAVGQFKTEIDGLGIHFLHARSPHADALPLLLTHGWPGSVVEFLKVIGPLVDPPDAADAFHVVCPSLPGYGFSDKPAATGWGVERIAGAWAELMARLGYGRYLAAGSDWGTSVSAALGRQDPGHVAGIHLVPPLAAPFGEPTESEVVALADRARADADSGYSAVHETRPQTIGYGLVDSPVALCAWIVEKLRSWSDGEDALTRDEILDTVMLYWLPGTGASSARLYRESIGMVQELFTRPGADVVGVPTGCSIFPRENPRPSRRWAERRFTDIRHWNELPRGGHFAAFEQPASLTSEIRAGFRPLRGGA